MNAEDCALGFQAPVFHDFNDLNSIRKAFSEDGIVFISNCDQEKLVALGKNLGIIVKPRNELGDRSGVSNIRCAPGLEGKGYTSQELFFHTDRSGWDLPPRILMTTLKVQAETGGFSLFVDTHHVVDELRLRNTALYNLITSSKFSSFRSDNGSFQPRPIYDERTGIFRYRFDDGIQLSASLVEQLPKLRNIFYQHAFAVELKPGQCYVADNHRFLHGHTSFTGSRELLRVLAHPHPALTRKFILFDVDGTLCRAEALSIDAYYRCITDASGREITHENTKVNLHGQTDVSLLHDILRYHNVPEAERDEVVKTFFDLHPQYLRDSLQKNGCDSIACPQVQEVLDWLPKESDSYGRPICIGLLTGNSKPNSLLKISAAGLSTNMFDLSISSFGDVHPTRTSLVRNSMRKIEAQHGIPIQPSDIVLIGDTPLDVQCARETGCRVVAVASGNYDKSSLIPFNPDFACDRLIEATDFLSTFLKASTE